MTIHNLKIKQEYLNQIIAGRKRFELRKDDRGFEVGDRLLLQEKEEE